MNTHAFPYQLAQEAILPGRYADAIDLLRPLSANNDPDAQFLHAYLHFWDDSLSRIEALDRMTYLANTGHAEANYILAICPDLSPGYQFSLPKRDEQLNRLKMAADAGSVYAMTDLAQCHIEGLFNNSSYEKARTLLDAAIERDIPGRRYPKSHFLIGCMKIYGVGGKVSTDAGLRHLAWDYLEHVPLFSNIMSIGIEMLKKSEVDFALPNRIKLRKRLDSAIERYEQIAKGIHSKNTPQWESFAHLHCIRTLHYNLIDSDFDAYSDFVFDHFIYPDRREVILKWNGATTVDVNGRKLLEYYTSLFKDFDVIRDRYSVSQIKQVLERQHITGGMFWSSMSVIFNPHLNTTVEDAVNCIQAMAGLYESLFQEEDFKEIGHKWLRNIFPRRSYGRKFNREELKYIELAFVDVMVQVLNMDSLDSQKAAIYGLEQYPQGNTILQKYIEEHPGHPAWIIEYARDAIEGRVL